jgi:hypothetical protein
MFVKRLLIAASPIATAVATALISAPTSAGVIDLSTGAAAWQLTAIQPFYAPYDAPAQNNVYGTLGAPAPTIIPNAAWNHTLESSADWIGPTTDSAVKGISGFYTFSLPIDTLLTPGDTYNIQGSYTADNGVVSLFAGDQSVPITIAPTEQGYKDVYTFNFDYTAGLTNTFSATLYNEDTTGLHGPVGPTPMDSQTNPIGLIMSASATASASPITTAVPEPATLSLFLAGSALLLVRRRRA